MLRAGRHCLPFIIVSLACLVFMSSVELSGDEKTYAKGANNLLLFLLGRREFDDIVRNGWFMPGMSAVLSPVQAVFMGDAPVVVLRAYMYLLNILLIVYIHWKLFISRGDVRGSYIAQAVMAANLYYPLAVSAVLSEILALHLGIALFLSVRDIHARLSALAFAFLMGLASFGLVIIRPLYLAAPLFIILAVIIGQWSGWRAFWRGLPHHLVQLAVMSAVMLALLLPWSMAVSSKFGPTLTLSSAATSRIIYFGGPDFVEATIGEEVKPGNMFSKLHKYLMEQADENDITYIEQSRLLHEAAAVDADMVGMTRENLSRFFAIVGAENYPERYVSLFCAEKSDCAFTETVTSIFSAWLQYVWYATAIVGALLFVLPRALNRDELYGSFIYKGLILLVCLHPFLMLAHPRYYSQLIVLIALACGTFRLSDTRSFWSNLARPQGVSVVEVGQVVCWLAAAAAAFVWLTGINPLV